MKKTLLALALVSFSMIAMAVGPQFPRHLSWDAPQSGPEVTGYFFYWRSPAESYSDARRIPLSTNSAPYDLTVLGLPKGDYFVMMTATNSWGESEPSDEFLWRYSHPNKPINVKITLTVTVDTSVSP